MGRKAGASRVSSSTPLYWRPFDGTKKPIAIEDYHVRFYRKCEKAVSVEYGCFERSRWRLIVLADTTLFLMISNDGVWRLLPGPMWILGLSS